MTSDMLRYDQVGDRCQKCEIGYLTTFKTDKETVRCPDCQETSSRYIWYQKGAPWPGHGRYIGGHTGNYGAWTMGFGAGAYESTIGYGTSYVDTEWEKLIKPKLFRWGCSEGVVTYKPPVFK